MKIQDKVHIKVLNYSDMKHCVETRNRGYVFEPARDGIPTFEFFNFEDIEYINSKSPIFRTGGLRFESNEEEEIFTALMHLKWKETVVTEDDLNNMIFNPTIANQERVVSIKDMATIERLRSKLVFNLNEGVDGISTKTADLINARFRELSANKINSQIVVNEIKPEYFNANGELALLKKQNEALELQLAKMQEMVQSIAGKQNSELANSEGESTETKVAKRGRPKTTENTDKE